MVENRESKLIRNRIFLGAWAVLAEFLFFLGLLFLLPVFANEIWVDFGARLPELTIRFLKLSDLMVGNRILVMVLCFPLVALATIVLQFFAIDKNKIGVAATIAVIPTVLLLLLGIACYWPFYDMQRLL